MPRRLAIVMCLGLMSCGSNGGDDGSGYVGIYKVTAHTLNSEGCDGPGDPVTDIEYFRLKGGEFLGQTFLSMGVCDTAMEESCEDPGIFNAFVKADGRWTQEIGIAYILGQDPCTLIFKQGFLQGETGEVAIETRSYSKTDDTLTSEECNAEAATLLGVSMPCTQFEVVVGELIE